MKRALKGGESSGNNQVHPQGSQGSRASVVWSGRERNGKGKELNACWIEPGELLWVGNKGGSLVRFMDSGML